MPLAQDGDSVAIEFIAVGRAAGHGHDQCQGGAGHQWPGAGGIAAVGTGGLAVLVITWRNRASVSAGVAPICSASRMAT